MTIRQCLFAVMTVVLATGPAGASWDESWLASTVDSQPKAAAAGAASAAQSSVSVRSASTPAGRAVAPTPRPRGIARAMSARARAELAAAREGGPTPVPQPEITGDSSATEEELYERANEALDDESWQQAIDAFREVEHLRGKRADRAIYWQAYAYYRDAALAQALDAVSRLRREYPKSRWMRDAEALELEVRQSAGQHVAPEAATDEELKLMVLNSLMSSSPDRAVPILQKLLRSPNSSPKVKRQALFVLSQSGTPEATQIVGDYARGEADPELQRTAVEYLGLYGGDENGQILEDIYTHSSGRQVRSKILESYMLSGQADRLQSVALKESDPELRSKAIEQIGLLGRADLLKDLYQKENEVELRRKIIEAFMLAGESEMMYDLARTEKEPELRLSAIEHLGLMGETDQLWELYRTETDRDLRSRIIQSFMLTGDDTHLLQVARTDSDPDLRASAVQQLGLMSESDSLRSLYFSEKDPEIRKSIIESLFLAGDDEGLIQIARREKDHDLKRAAVEKLALINSKEATDFLMELIDQ